VPEPSSANLPPNPSSVQPIPDRNVPAPTMQPEEQNPVPEPVINQGPNPVDQAPEPVINQGPNPVNQAPEPVINQGPNPVDQAPEPEINQGPNPVNQAPEPVIVNVPGFAQPITDEPAPSSQNPEVGSIPEPVINLRGKRAILPPPKNDTVLPPLTPADNVTNSTDSPSINNSTLNATTTNFTSQWVHVFFTPKTFNVTILSNITDIYFIKNGPCMPLLDYWKNVTLGCPCNGTWNNTGYYNSSSKSFEGGRQITPSLCPNNTCQEAFFLNDTTVYANLRLNTTTWSNGTIANKTVEITKVSPFKEIGYAYGEKDIIAVLLLSNGTDVDLPSVIEVTRDMNETLDYNGSMSLPLTSVVTMMFAFLLIMYESTQ